MAPLYHGFGGKLYHDVPSWVTAENFFHIRIRSAAEQCPQLTEPELARAILNSVVDYERRGRWWANLVLIMPDHLHALVAFPPDQNMSEVVQAWKRYHRRVHRAAWQDGYFDHRLRDLDTQWRSKAEYIRQNPVVKKLCARAEDWPWVYESGRAV